MLNENFLLRNNFNHNLKKLVMNYMKKKIKEINFKNSVKKFTNL